MRSRMQIDMNGWVRCGGMAVQVEARWDILP